MLVAHSVYLHGLDIFDKAHEDGIIEAILTTNCIYQTEELKSKSWYKNVDVTAYLAKIIDCINHDSSIGGYLDPVEKIHNFVKRYNEQK